LNSDPTNPAGFPPWFVQGLQQFGIGNAPVVHAPLLDYPWDNWVSSLLQNFGISWNPSMGTVNGMTYDAYTDPTMGLWWVARSLEVFEDLQQFGTYLVQNPVVAFQYLISWQLFDFPLHVEELAFAANVPFQAVYAAIPAAAAAPVASLGGLGGLGALAALPQTVVAPALAPVAAPSVLPAVALTSIAVPATAPATAPAPAPTPSAPAPAAPAPPPPPPPAAPAGVAFVPPYAIPGIGLGSGMSTSASSSAKRKAPAAGSVAAAAAAAATREAARARRRRRAGLRGYGDEYMDMNIDVDPDWGAPAGGQTSASDRGAGSLGFAGTAPKESVAEAAGLTTLAGDEFGGGPKMPMMPGTWDPDGPDESGRHSPSG
jgi:PPE-repeat protein